jgi:hypothetical protein
MIDDETKETIEAYLVTTLGTPWATAAAAQPIAQD